MAVESEEIKRARQDVTDRATEHDRALQVAQATGLKLQQAQQRLQQLQDAAKKAAK